MEEQQNNDKPHYLKHRERLRERFNKSGIEGLLPHEVIELFLTYTMTQKDVKESAHQIIKKFGSIKGFFEASEEELSEIKYFKDNALTLRRFVKELSQLYQKQVAENIPLTQSKDELIKYCKNKLGNLSEEEFWIISLDSKYSIIRENLISKGISDRSPVYPKKIIETAIQNKAHSILLLHNHPNGNPEASEQDIAITKAIDIPSRILNISIYDHIIVAGDKHFSFKENKII